MALRAEEAEALNTALADGGLTPDHPSAVFGAGRGRAAGAPDDDTLYVAFAARTSGEELQDPTISIPRQLESCRRALPPNAVIVAFFWDVESGRKEIDDRERAHDKFEITVPRDGGLPELLAEAKRKDRRFDAVICESVDRIARLMHQSTRVEHELDRVGVPLFAADEGVETTRRKSTKILVRRTKQMLAEWYVRQMLELAWDGYCEHTRQGWNIGVPPYGYAGERVPHPVPAKREQGMTKTRLVPEPDRAPVVHQIFVWRVTERLSYDAIAERLNADLDSYPPKKSVRRDQHRTTWSTSGVRDVLENPKYTGFMVWNRRASKTGAGKLNPPRDWVWSPRPTHEPLVTVEMFKAAQAVKPERLVSRTRSRPGLHVNHPDTKRSYILRSYVFCAQCDRRMFGKTRHTRSYFGCQPRETRRPEEVLRFHQKSVWVRQDALLEGVLRFLAERECSGRTGRSTCAPSVAATPDRDKALEKEAATLRRAVEDIDRKKSRLVHQLEERDDPDGTVFRAVRERLAELTADRQKKLARLGALLDLIGQGSDADDAAVLDDLPIARLDDLIDAPEAVLRTVFDALRLRLVYDGRTGEADCPSLSRTTRSRRFGGPLVACPAMVRLATGWPGWKRMERRARTAIRSHPLCALGRIRTYAPGSGGQCSIP